MLGLPFRAALATAGLGLASALFGGCGGDVVSPARTPLPGASKSAPLFAPNYVSTPRLFTSAARFSALAATPGRLLAATVGAAPAKLVEISEDGDLAPFAPHFVLPAELECALVCAPGTRAFAQDQVFVGAGSEIWQLPEDGSAALLLAALPSDEGNILSLTFDDVGMFGYDLVALTRSGAVYRLDVQARAQRVGSFGEGARTAQIAPARFGRCAGQLVAAFPLDSDVRAMDGAGTVTPVMRWSGATGVWFVPDDPRAFAGTSSGLFVATGEGALYQFAASDLTLHGGELLVTTFVRSGNGLLTPEGSGYRSRPFSRFMGVETAAGFVRRPAVTRIAIDILPGNSANAVVLGTTATIPVALLSSTGFTPATLDGGDLVLAGAHAVPNSRGRLATYSDINRDGVLDLVTQFAVADLALVPGDWTLQLDGTALVGDHVRGADRVLVVTP